MIAPVYRSIVVGTDGSETAQRAVAAAAAPARRPAAPAGAQSLTIAITELTTTSSRIRTCIQ